MTRSTNFADKITEYSKRVNNSAVRVWQLCQDLGLEVKDGVLTHTQVCDSLTYKVTAYLEDSRGQKCAPGSNNLNRYSYFKFLIKEDGNLLIGVSYPLTQLDDIEEFLKLPIEKMIDY